MLIPANDVDWNEFTIENIYNWCKPLISAKFGRAKEAVAMNKILAQDGIDNSPWDSDCPGTDGQY